MKFIEELKSICPDLKEEQLRSIELLAHSKYVSLIGEPEKVSDTDPIYNLIDTLTKFKVSCLYKVNVEFNVDPKI